MLTAEIVEGFVQGVLASNFDQRVVTPKCHREWWELCCSPNRFVAIAAPRGFAKSTSITHSYTLANLLFRERSFAMIVSDTETQAVMFLQDIKKELQDNEKLANLFKLSRDSEGKVKFVKDAETDIIVQFEDGHMFRVLAKGSEQKVRGIKWGHKRPDLIVCDDLENDEIVLNKERREKFRKWFYGALLPCRSENGIVRVVGTILHMDSLLERLMPETQLAAIRRQKALIREPLKEWTDVKLPWLSVKYRAHDVTYEHLLWHEKKDEDELKKIKADYTSQGMPDVYAQEYLNIPIDESTAYFKKSDFVAMKSTDWDRNVSYYITGDLAISEKERADYSAFAIGGMDENGVLQIRRVIRDRMDGRELVDLMLKLQEQLNPVAFGLEEGQISKSIRPFLNEEMIKRNIFINLVLLKPSTDKMTRARSIQARMRAGGVRFDKEGQWYQTFEDECVRFPRDKHDDQVDALSYLGLLIDKMVEAPTAKEMLDEQYEEDFARSGLSMQGRNVYTGY